MDIKIVLLLFLAVVCCVCLPVYHAVNRTGFKIYAAWVCIICAIWCLLVFCTDIIC